MIPDRGHWGSPTAGEEPPVQQLSGLGVTVAVVDSGWDRNVRDPRVLPGIGLVGTKHDFELESSYDDHDRNGHGTACAQLVVSIAREAHIFPIRVFGRRLETSTSQLAAALDVATRSGADVISLSLATGRTDAVRPLFIQCEKARRRDIIVVASAKRLTRLSFPAAFENVIGVEGAGDLAPHLIRYRRDDAVEVVACGLPGFCSTGVARGPNHYSNSAACARVAGMVALFKQEQPQGTLEGARRWLARRARARGT